MIILGGQAFERLGPVTKHKSKGEVSFRHSTVTVIKKTNQHIVHNKNLSVLKLEQRYQDGVELAQAALRAPPLVPGVFNQKLRGLTWQSIPTNV